jgi:transcriptional regulator with XRE-family HTH domain
MNQEASHFGSMLRRERESKGMSLRALAELVNASPSQLARLEQGHVNPGLSLAVRLSKVFGKSIEDLGLIDSDIPTSNTTQAIHEAVEQVAQADPRNIQEVAASQLAIINSYYLNGLEQSQQSFRWSLIWGGIGLGFLITAVGVLLFRQPTEIAYASGIGGAILDLLAGTYLFLYKHASDQLASFRLALDNTQRLLLANSMCEGLEKDAKQQARMDLIRIMVTSATPSDIPPRSNKSHTS